MAGTSGAALLGAAAGTPRQNHVDPQVFQESLPLPGNSGIRHIVVLMMENRSFDHYFGWLPNADGQQNASYPTLPSGTMNTYPLYPDYQGCGHPNPDHSYLGSRVSYNNGAMDGWLLNPNNDAYAIGFYNETDLPFKAALARNYTTLDHAYSSILGPTYPNRFFYLAAQTDRLDNTLFPSRLPTIFDRLMAAGISTRYYYSNLPFVALWGLKYFGISRLYGQFLFDAALGRLPAVSFVDPRFTTDEEADKANDDEPHTNVMRGDALVAATFRAVARSPVWSSTVLIVTYDEGGGFCDHVAPPRADAPNDVDPDLVDDKALLGFRVPTIVASPWTRGNPASPRVVSDVFDHTSILKLIEWRWGLAPLTARDASSDVGNLAAALDFGNKITAVPPLPQVQSPPSSPCSQTTLQTTPLRGRRRTPWADLSESELLEGWPRRHR
jgi:phospholipase C